jgi:hypothetical protein
MQWRIMVNVKLWRLSHVSQANGLEPRVATFNFSQTPPWTLGHTADVQVPVMKKRKAAS